MELCKVNFWKKAIEGITGKTMLLLLIGSMICSFGIHNIHQRINITEGGIIGLMLLIEHWLNISPAYITPFLDIACYILAFKFLGLNFIKLSVIATLFISSFYKIWELFPPILPDLSACPLIAAISGGVFVGIGVGLIVRQGGSGGGDDALALTISHTLRWKLSRSYLFTVSAKYSCGFPDPQVLPIIVVERYLDYFTTIMEDRLWQVLAKPVFRWRNRSGLSMNAAKAA